MRLERNDIDDAKLVRVLLTVCIRYVTLKKILAPQLLNSKSYRDIVKVLKEHYTPKKLVKRKGLDSTNVCKKHEKA